MATSSVLKNLFVFFLILTGLYFAKEFLVPLTLGALLATLLLPFSQWMERNRIPRIVAVLTCLLVFLIIIAGLGALLGWQISNLTDDFAVLKEKMVLFLSDLQQFIKMNFGITAKEQTAMVKEQQTAVSGILQTIADSTFSIFSGFILTMVYMVLLLYYRGHLKNFILRLSTQLDKTETEELIYRAADVSQRYLVGLSKMIVCLWIMYGIGFSLVGVENALFFAVLCGLLEIVPFIGNLTGTTITVLVSAVNGASYTMLGGIVLVYGTVQFIQGWVLEPLIVGPHVKVNPLFTIIALVLGNIVWGIPGIVLAIPLTAIAKIICDHIESLKPYGFLIGELENNRPESGFVRKLKLWFKNRK
jgi:predicted PurR-regulated permease PerM